MSAQWQGDCGDVVAALGVSPRTQYVWLLDGTYIFTDPSSYTATARGTA